VKLPKADLSDIAAEAASESTAASVREACAGARILLAEDNAISAEVVLDFLRETGLAVDRASDGAQALELARTNGYDLVLMDMQMPRMDGLEATRRIRTLPKWRDRPIIALTANVFAEDRQRCTEAGMNDFLSKPVRPPHLYGMLLKWLARRPRPFAPPGPTAPELPAPDLQAGALNELARRRGMNRERVLDFGNQPAKYMRMLDMLVTAHAPELTRISQCLASGDLQRGSSIAHGLRGAAAMLGAEGVQRAAAYVEDALRAGDTAAAELALPGLRQSFDELSQTVRALREAPVQE
jgi:CheY-like chemotaxis protein